jgi:hypothetical protein
MHTWSPAELNLGGAGGAEGWEEMAFNRVESDTDWKHREGASCAIILLLIILSGYVLVLLADPLVVPPSGYYSVHFKLYGQI